MFQGLRMRKRSLLSGLCFMTLVYAGVQLYVQDEYSPLQLLSGVEKEASRLLRFISQPQVHCNDSVGTGNSSRWLICLDSEIGVSSLRNEEHRSLVYSVGPEKDFSFEQVVSWNFSTKLYVFLHQGSKAKRFLHANPSRTSLYSTGIVPNDPADFARNSFDSQTLNSVMKTLQHDHLDLLKLDSFTEGVQSFDVLRFIVQDSLLQNVKELHFIIRLDKLEEDFIYSWYRVLYELFNTAGFRLYHTSASDPLCLQDTVMESCSYFLSWVKRPPPHVYVAYPPAIDGSPESEEDRLVDYLQGAKAKAVPLTPVVLKMDSRNPGQDMNANIQSIGLATAVLEKNAQSCNMIIIRSSDDRPLALAPIERCRTHNFVWLSQANGSVTFQRDSRSNERGSLETTEMLGVVSSSQKNIMFVDVHSSWRVLGVLSSIGLPKYLDQLIVRGHIFPSSRWSAHSSLRSRYSELKRLEEFSLSLVLVDKVPSESINFASDGDLYSLSFVKTAHL